ncbi:MAG: peroxiredoxin family protein [Flavobacteriales bacterium]|nr:peroxiredoxin family protein [Flavobacteriales bacterium]
MNSLLINHLSTVFLVLMPSMWVCAQTAPDFTITDTDGNEWNLYEQVALGKTVVLDFFYVNCVPCQGQSPELSIMYQDYLSVGSEVLVLGISNRDSDFDVEQFDITYNITYPTAGEEGGGDTVTTLYQSWFQFFGWPSYGIVCPDSSINWGIFPSVPNVPELRGAVDECLGTSSVGEEIRMSDYLTLESNQVHIRSENVKTIRLVDVAGRELYCSSNSLTGKSIDIPSVGISILTIELENHQTIHQKLYR